MNSQALATTYSVLGIDISSYNKVEFYRTVEEGLAQPTGQRTPMFIVTVNPEIAIQTIVDYDFKSILSNYSINTADGKGISWAVKFLYGVKMDRITGSDSVEEICRIAAGLNNTVFFYGAMPSVAARAARILEERIPELQFAGTYSPERPDLMFEELPEATQQELKKANVVFVALGAPAQEKWIYKNLSHLPACKLIIGIGGSLDFITGDIKRAPRFFRNTGIEWMYRLYSQPSRWRRMLKLPLFAINIVLLKASASNGTAKQLPRQKLRVGHL